VWAKEDEKVDSDRTVLEGEKLSAERERELDACLGKWAEVLSDKTERTHVLKHHMSTCERPAVRSYSYQIPHKWKAEELERMQEQGMIANSQSE